MPAPKRTLAEADPSASAPAPAAKKASPRVIQPGEMNQDFKSKTVAELTSMLKERGLPHTGRKAQLIQRLDDASKTTSGETHQAIEVSPDLLPSYHALRSN
jgi:SAP domain